jgi:hypothetical protein
MSTIAVVAAPKADSGHESAPGSARSAPTARRPRATAVVDTPALLEKVTKNFTMVPNEYLDLLTSLRLRPVTTAVLVFLVRQIPGSWGKSARSSCDFSTREIAAKMGFESHSPVVRALQELEEKRIIWITTTQVRPKGRRRRGPQGRSISLTHPSEWRLDLHSGAPSAPDPSDSSGAESAPQLVSNQHQKRCEISTNFAAKPIDPKGVRPSLRLQREDEKKEDKAKAASASGADAPSSSSFKSKGGTKNADPVLLPHEDEVRIDGQVLFVPNPPLQGPATPEVLAALWNCEIPEGHPRIGLSARTRPMAKTAIAIEPDPNRWRVAFREVGFSEFLMGKTPPKDGRAPFVVPFEWFMRVADGRLVNVEKALSRQYRSRGQDCRAGLSWSQYARGLSTCQTLRDFEREREEGNPRPKGVTPEERDQLQREREENTGVCDYCGRRHDLRSCPRKRHERFREAVHRADERTIALQRGEPLPTEPVHRDVSPALDF